MTGAAGRTLIGCVGVPADYVPTDITIPKTCTIREDDAAFHMPLQEHLARSLGFKEVRMRADHSSFPNQPD